MITHSGGKDRMKDIISLKALRVAVIAISNFDILNDKRKLLQLTVSYGIDDKEITCKLDIIYECINADNGKIRNLIKDNDIEF